MEFHRGYPSLSDDQAERFADLVRESGRVDYEQRIGIESLDNDHYQAFVRALTNALSTEDALFAFAQLVDGLPVADIAWGTRNPSLGGGHPIDKHEELCPGSLEKARDLRGNLDPKTLKLNQKLVRAFRKAPVGSRAFKTRLIEMTSVAVHELAAMVFKAEYNLHQGDIKAVANYVKPYYGARAGKEPPPPPSLFNLMFYLDVDIYPDGAANVVGYWAENWVLGGVVLFDRKGEAASPENPPNVYIHPDRKSVTMRICQLRDDQQNALLDFLLDEKPSSCPLPLLPDMKNLVRVDSLNSLLHHQIYRDVWERKQVSRLELMFSAGAAKTEVDYPEARALLEHVNTLPLSAEIVDMGPAPCLSEEEPATKNQEQDSGAGPSVSQEPVDPEDDVQSDEEADDERKRFFVKFFEEVGIHGLWNLSDSDKGEGEGEHSGEEDVDKSGASIGDGGVAGVLLGRETVRDDTETRSIAREEDDDKCGTPGVGSKKALDTASDADDEGREKRRRLD